MGHYQLLICADVSTFGEKVNILKKKSVGCISRR